MSCGVLTRDLLRRSSFFVCSQAVFLLRCVAWFAAKMRDGGGRSFPRFFFMYRHHLTITIYFGLFVLLLYPCRCAARPRDPETKPKAFFSHTEQTRQGESSSWAPHLVEVTTSVLDGRGLATFYDVNDLKSTLGIPLAPQIAKAVKTSFLATNLAHLRAASST